MDFRNGRESRNVEDRRGQGGRRLGGGGKIGIGTIVLALIAMYFGIDPSVVLNTSEMVAPPAIESTQSGQPRSPAEDEMARFVSMVLADTEDTWGPIFKAGGAQYREPGMVLYTGATRSACGVGQAEMGPFYCPADGKVYLDLSFFNELGQRYGAQGDFAQAYVIAHEVGHHVQNLLGTTGKVDGMRGRVSQREQNALSVRLELQADCYAGIWANKSQQAKNWLEQGDIESAVNAAEQIGDDALQRQQTGTVRPDAFTHGSSAQRVRWFTQGFKTGSVQGCNTFNAQSL